MKNVQIVFTEANKAQLLPCETRMPGNHEVMVKTCFSTISCGTERANITGDPNVSIAPAETIIPFPRYAGYCSSGIICAKGSQVEGLEVGDRVAMSWSHHKSVNTLDAHNVMKLDKPEISLQSAALCHIGTFPLAALRKTRLEIGESLLVMGLGILGLWAVQLGHLAGAVPVIAVDPKPERRKKALQFGADYALDPMAPGFTETVKTLTHGGTQTAIEVTGMGQAWMRVWIACAPLAG